MGRGENENKEAALFLLMGGQGPIAAHWASLYPCSAVTCIEVPHALLHISWQDNLTQGITIDWGHNKVVKFCTVLNPAESFHGTAA